LRRPEQHQIGARLSLEGQHRDGSRFPSEVGLAPIATDQGTAIAATMVDRSSAPAPSRGSPTPGYPAARACCPPRARW
jgi:hypothetical protein